MDAMPHRGEADEEYNPEFKWGKKKGVGGTNRDVQFYESFTYDCVDYFLYDCVYLYHVNEPEPYIGKLVKIWENPNHEKRVKIVWFFRPIEIRNWLIHDVPLENEIFLASGEGKGLSNINPLEALAGKCNVVCTSKDKRNPQASDVELRRADYIFYRTFDVKKLTVSDKFEDEIDHIPVRYYFNKKEDQKVTAFPNVADKATKHSDNATKHSDKAAPKLAQDKGTKTDNLVVEVTRQPDVDRSKWFKQLPWEQRLQRAHEKGTLVLLENLDPSFTSTEVEFIVLHVFKEKATAKMIQRNTFSSPCCGQAFVIFKSEDVTERIITKLRIGCLMLPNGRPLVGRRGTLGELDKSSKFIGHLSIDKIKLKKQREEMRNAVSTSHLSQPNTIAYDMAVEWCLLQERSDKWWKALYEQHEKEFKHFIEQIKGRSDKLPRKC